MSSFICKRNFGLEVILYVNQFTGLLFQLNSFQVIQFYTNFSVSSEDAFKLFDRLVFLYV